MSALITGLGPVLDGSQLPSGLSSVVGRSPFQRHLHHLARVGVGHCVVVYAGPALRAVQEECRRQQGRLGKAPRLYVRPPDAREEIESILGDAVEVLILTGNAVFDPRLYDAARAAAGSVDFVDPEGSDGPDSGTAVVSGRIGLAKLTAAAIAEHGLAGAAGLEPRGTRGSANASGTGDGERRDDVRERARNGSTPVSVDSLPAYLPELRRRLRPYWLPIRSGRDRAKAGDLILDSAQKGVLDFPARYFHPLLENPIARTLSETRVTPNQVTLLTAVLGFGATYLFADGRYAWALVLALLVNILDGVDGKLARIKLLASRFGDRLDHALDVAFEFSWYAALGWRLGQQNGIPAPLEAGVGLIVLMAGCRAASGVYRTITGRQIHDHTRFDSAFRLVAGRRNIYVLLLLAGLVAGRLESALYVCFWWGAVTLAVYVLRILVALGRRGFRHLERHPG